MTRGVAALGVATLPIWLTASPASALEVHAKTVVLEHTFKDFAGVPVTCQVEFDSSIISDTSGSPFRAEADTQSFSPFGFPPGETCASSVLVEIAYRDVAGRPRQARAFGDDIVDLQLDEVQGNIVATHDVFFLNCLENCEISSTTSPK